MMYESSTAPKADVAGLEDYIEAVRKRALLVLSCGLIGLLLGIAYTRKTDDTFEATARVLLAPTPVGGLDGGLVAPNLDRESAVLSGDSIGATAVAQVGPGASYAVSTSFVPTSDVISISVKSPSAARASTIANAYAQVYVDQRVNDQTTFYTSSDASITGELSELDLSIRAGQDQLTVLDQATQDLYSQLPQNAEEIAKRNALIATNGADRNAALSQLNTRILRQQTLQLNLVDLRRRQAATKPAAEVIGVAVQPNARLGLSDRVFWIVAMLLGLLLGVVAAFLRERLDRSVQVAKDVELALGGRVIGAIPKFGIRARRGQWSLVMAHGRGTAAIQRTREAYRRLRTSVMFVAKADGVKAVVVTSNRPAEGKSTTAANLAISLALGGVKTVLVSADMRRSSIEASFGLSNDRGLSSYLGGGTDTIRSERIAGVENLVVIPAGPEPSNPGELLGTERFAALLEHLRTLHDMIVIDTPPLGAAADSLVAASLADGLIVVVDGSKTDTTDLLEMRNELDRTGITLLGAVLNRDTSQPKGIFGRRSRYGYYASDRSTVGGAPNVSLEATTEAISLGDRRGPRQTRRSEPMLDDVIEVTAATDRADVVETLGHSGSESSPRAGSGRSSMKTNGRRAGSDSASGRSGQGLSSE
jgi:capsular exopolysaccharide synthesis family protein